MGVAMLGVRALVALSPPDLPRVGAIGVDGAVFAFGLGVTTLIGSGRRADPGAAGVARTSRTRHLQHGSRARGRRASARAERAGRRRSGAGARAAGELGAAAAEPGAAVRGRRRLRLVGACSRCRCRRPATGSTTTAPRIGSSPRRSRRCGACPASRRPRSRASCRSAATSTSTACTSIRVPPTIRARSRAPSATR